MLSFLNYSLFLALYLIIFSINTSKGAFSEELSDKTTHLHFYFHDVLGGTNPTSVNIISRQNTNSGFGDIYMIDDALTEGPESTSKMVGRAQGMYAMASQNDIALLMVVNYEFTEGKYKGSSISILGRNPVMNDVREMGIVGGSGVFRFARGYALIHTVQFDATTGDAVVEYNVYVQRQNQQPQQQFASSCGHLAAIGKYCWYALFMIWLLEITSFSNRRTISLL